jgi:hypothetical protein
MSIKRHERILRSGRRLAQALRKGERAAPASLRRFSGLWSRGFSGEVNLLDAVAYAKELFSYPFVGLPAGAVAMNFVPA